MKDPLTWAVPEQTVDIEDPVWGTIELTRWRRLHLREAANIPLDLILIRRKGKKIDTNEAKPIWLGCTLLEMFPLEEVWRIYQQRFNIDHWNRFAKQRLGL